MLAGLKLVCTAGVFSHTAPPFGYRCATPAATLSPPCCNSMLNAEATSIPKLFSATKKLRVQSRAARFTRGVALRSVCHTPAPLRCAARALDISVSPPPASAGVFGRAVNAPLLGVAEIADPFPAVPMVLDVMVRDAPLACAQTPVEPALTSSSKHFAMLAALSPAKFRCEIDVGPSEIS